MLRKCDSICSWQRYAVLCFTMAYTTDLLPPHDYMIIGTSMSKSHNIHMPTSGIMWHRLTHSHIPRPLRARNAILCKTCICFFYGQSCWSRLFNWRRNSLTLEEVSLIIYSVPYWKLAPITLKALQLLVQCNGKRYGSEADNFSNKRLGLVLLRCTFQHLHWKF